MRFLSLFSGIGGMDLGLERAGWECVGQVEIDEYCKLVLSKHWPNVPKFGDIRSVTSKQIQETVGQFDAIVGGFPCQDISVAGKHAGLGGARSGLWWEMRRLIAECRPNWLLIENVPALRVRGADTVLHELEAMEYTGWPLVVGARHTGLPHRRDRVFIVSHANGKLITAGAVEAGNTMVEAVTQREELGSGSARRGVALGDTHQPRTRKQRVATGCAKLGKPGVVQDNANSPRLEGWWQAFAPVPASRGQRQYDWECNRATVLEPRVGVTANGFPFKLAMQGVGNAVAVPVAQALGEAISAAQGCLK